MSQTTDPVVLSTSDEAATFVTNLSGWVARGGQFWGADERMARWSGATHVPCSECGQPVQKSWTKCEACRDAADIAKYAARERRPWAGEYLYSDAIHRYFDDEDDLRDYLDDGEYGHTVETLRLLICEPVYAKPIDADDLFADDLPEDCTLGDVAGDIDDWIAKVNECIAMRRKAGKPLSWMPGRYAVDLSTLPVDLRPSTASGPEDTGTARLVKQS